MSAAKSGYAMAGPQYVQDSCFGSDFVTVVLEITIYL